MAKRRKRNSFFNKIGYQLSMLACLGGFIGGLGLFKDIDSGLQKFVFAGITSLLATLGVMIILLIFKQMFEQKEIAKQTFDFEQVVEGKNQLATQFEHDVSSLIHQLTKKRTEVVGGSGDGGIDIKVFDDNNQLVGIVQCKHSRSNKALPPSYIRELNTVRHLNHVNIAYLVTTGYFSEESDKLAKQLGVRLIDGKDLKSLRKKTISSNDPKSDSPKDTF